MRHDRRSRQAAVRLGQRPGRQVPEEDGRRHQRSRAGARGAVGWRAARAHRPLPRAAGRRRDARRPAGRGLRHGARGLQADARPAPLRRPADGRHGAASGQDRRDEDRRRQDAGRDAAGLPQRARGQGRARGHRQRLPGAPRRRLDGADLRVPRPLGRLHRARPGRGRAQAGLWRRHHLRDQQRVRLRLPARQHEVLAREHGPARLQLRDRRRGRQHPGRRGADAPDHLGAERRELGALPHGRRLYPAAVARRLREGREGPHRVADRERHREDAGLACRGRPAQAPRALRRRQRHAGPSRQPGAARAPAVHPRRRLSGQERQGRDRRRVHRAHDGGAALLRRPAPGARGQGAGADPAGEPDARLDHLPELFPALPEARRDDRHGGDRGLRVRRDLRPRGGRDPDPHGDDPRGRGRRGLSHRGREEQGDRRLDQRGPRARPAGAGRHRQHREVGAAFRAAEEGEDPAPGAERPLPRAGGVHRRPGRALRRGHDRDQHGRPRHRHPARRQCPDARAAGARRHRGRGRARAPRRGDRARDRGRARPRDRGRRAVRARHRAPRSRGASTTSCAAARAARATPAARSSSCRSKTT